MIICCFLTLADLLPSWWISSLFGALFPPMHRLGHFANLNVAKIPEAIKAFPVIEEYCKDVIYWPNYTPGDHNLLTTAYQVARIAFFLNRTQAHPVILRSPLNTLLSAIPSYTRLTDSTVHPILPELLWALNGTDTRGTHFGICVLEYVSDQFICFRFLNCLQSCPAKYVAYRC